MLADVLKLAIAMKKAEIYCFKAISYHTHTTVRPRNSVHRHSIMKLLCALLAIVSPFAFAQIDTPVSQLPKSISCPEGQVALVADFRADRLEGKIPVFFVNRSDHDIKLGAQDGDVYLKLEALTEDGQWVRAQSHFFSFCGLSYVSLVIRKDHFLRIEGYQAVEGRKAKIRYRIYLQKDLNLVTQDGDGLCLDTDIRTAALDQLALRVGSLEFVASVARGEKKAADEGDRIRDMQPAAIWQLGDERFPVEKVLPVLDEIDSKFPKYKDITSDIRRDITQRKPQAEQ